MAKQTPHDSLFRYAFSQPAQAADHFRRNLPPAVVEAVKWDTLVLQPGSFVDEHLAQLHSDVLYQVRLEGRGKLLLYVLAEHQSRPDPTMPLRLLRYMSRIWTKWADDNGNRLPLPHIVPMVIYNGERNWNVPTAFADILPDKLRTELARHIPTFEYDLQDLSQLRDEDLAGEALRQLVLLLLKHARDGDFWQRLPAWFELFAKVASDSEDGLRAVMAVWRYITDVTLRPPPDDVLALLADRLSGPPREVVMGWAEQLRDEGRTQGRLQGRIEQLVRLVRLKFGELPPEVITKLEAASEDQLDAWTERILTAETLEALFS